MIKKRFVIPVIILILVCLLLEFNTYAQSDAIGFTDFDKLMKDNPAEGLNQLAQNPITDTTTTQMSGYGQIGEVTPASTGSLSSGVNLQDIIGSTRIAIMGGHIVGGMIVSSIDNNAVPAFNPLTGDVIIYNMDKGDTVLIDYAEGSAYNTKVSEGVEAEIQTPNRIRFTAYGKDSVLKVKPTEEPSYEFNNGLLEYENDKILEQINTTKLDDASVDADYRYGFKCTTLSPEANYNYIDKGDESKSFSIRNDNRKDYTVCARKTAYDEYNLESNMYSGLVDVMNDNFLLKAGITLFKEDSSIYQGFDVKNLARIESGVETTKFSLENKAPRTELISKVYTGAYKIIEKMIKGVVHRGFDYSKERNPTLINLYSSNMSKYYAYGDIRLTKDGTLHYYSPSEEKKITMHDPESATTKKCEELLKEVLTYEQNIETELEYLEKC